jgi:hypothetical protein
MIKSHITYYIESYIGSSHITRFNDKKYMKVNYIYRGIVYEGFIPYDIKSRYRIDSVKESHGVININHQIGTIIPEGVTIYSSQSLDE